MKLAGFPNKKAVENSVLPDKAAKASAALLPGWANTFTIGATSCNRPEVLGMNKVITTPISTRQD